MDLQNKLATIGDNDLVKVPYDEEYYLSKVAIPFEQNVYGKITVNDIKSSLIPVLDKEILIARFSENQIRELDANYAGDRIKKAINLAVFTVGFKVDNLSELIIMVIQDIFYDFSSLTIPEIELAFRMGSRRKFEPIMGMTVATFYGWLVSYRETVKVDAVRTLMTIKEAPVEVSEEQKKFYHDKWLKSYIENFEAHKNGEEVIIFDTGNVFYNYCEINGIGSLSYEERIELFEKAKKVIKGKHHFREAKNGNEVREFKVIYDAINANDIDVPLKVRIICEAKRLAVTRIFDKLIVDKLELKDLIDAIEAKESESNELNKVENNA